MAERKITAIGDHMTQQRLWEAVWTLQSGPLQDEEVVRQIFFAVGEMTSVQPVRYDLNRRGQWRPYGGRKLIVDVLTQRTQLVTVVEDVPVDEGGTQVVVATGKQGEPPQAVARWWERWPPSAERIDAVEAAVADAFDTLDLASFVLRVADVPDEMTAPRTTRLEAPKAAPETWNRRWRRDDGDRAE